MTNPCKPRLRRKAPKTRTGCKTCKSRKVKCDERKPTCLRCERLDLVCAGYESPKPWIFEIPTRDASKVDLVTAQAEQGHDKSNILVRSGSDELQISVSRSPTITPDPPRPPLIIPLRDAEDLMLMQTYLHFITECPVAWESTLFGRENHVEMTSEEITKLHTDTPVTKVSHLAMATATLHLFQPNIFSVQLQFKYLQLAIVEIRKRVVKQAFEMDDLLHGVSQIFLAAVLIGDVVAAQAHLAAARELVHKKGGLDRVLLPTAQALEYGDLHLAVETISPPVFLTAPYPQVHYPYPCSSYSDTHVLKLCAEVRESAEKHRHLLFKPLVRCFFTFAECAIVLAHAWSEGPGKVDLGKLEWIAANCMGAYNVLLRTGSPKIQLSKLQEDARHTLVLWIQLICFLGNSSIMRADVRGSTVAICNQVLQRNLSLAVRRGLKEWTEIVSAAKVALQDREDTASQDLWQLISVVRNMEVGQPVQVGPLMTRLWELKKDHRGVKVSQRTAVDTFQKRDQRILSAEA
jgi:Fungal Zn(2)-Cys(6) binuclear cluster domain